MRNSMAAPEGMIEGLWTAEFGATTGIFGTGVVVFHDGKILGGDHSHYYVGGYTLRASTLKAKLRVMPYVEGAESVFGTVGKELTLELEGTLMGRQVRAQGYPVETPNLKFGVKLIKRT